MKYRSCSDGNGKNDDWRRQEGNAGATIAEGSPRRSEMPRRVGRRWSAPLIAEGRLLDAIVTLVATSLLG